MTYEWYFAPLLGGQSSGLNDSGVSYFESDPVRSLTKETIQDSLDALDPSESKTIVKFNTFNVTKEEIPNYSGLYMAFQQGTERWKHCKNTKHFFENGLKTLSQSLIPVLAIQDFQTIGLSKVGNRKTGGWYTLVSASGVTEKGPTEGGSYGIGKNAPFAASALRTVLYSTKNRENEIGFQGVARIPTIADEDNEDTQGTGYYYDIVNKQPVKQRKNILKPYRREDYGTDKFVLGFNDLRNWKERMIDEIISSYLLAIYRERLEVRVNSFIINKSTLPKAIEIIKEYKKDSLALQYYEVMNSSLSKEFTKKFKTDRGIEETVTLRLLVKDGFKKRVGLHRSTGMKIDDKGHFQTPIDFSGVLIVEGDELNAILREMEPPTHDKWDYKLYKKDTKYAEKLIRKLNRWMNSCSRKLLKSKSEKDIQIRGIEELLPDLSDEQPKTIEVKKEALKDQVAKVYQGRKRRSRRSNPSIPTDNGVPGKRLGGKRKGKPKEESRSPQHKGTQQAKISKVTVFCTNIDEQLYSIIIELESKGQVTLVINAVGENGQTSKVDIVDANINKVKIPTKINVIGPVYLQNNKTVNLTMKLRTSNRLALEVTVL